MLISIVTCSYNSEKTIERTIKSVLSQGFQDFEYLIIDGGSSDGTLEIVKKYIPLFTGKMRVISEKDKGIYDAMNKGIRLSKGEYIWLVNSDDYLEQDALSTISQHINQNPSKVICGQVEYFSETTDERRIFKYTPAQSEREFKKKRMGIVHPATIVSRKIYEDFGLYDDRFYISADMDWFLRIRENNVEIDFIDVKLSNMSDGGISGQTNNIDKRMHDWKLLFQKHTRSKLEYLRYLTIRTITFYKTFVFKI